MIDVDEILRLDKWWNTGEIWVPGLWNPLFLRENSLVLHKQSERHRTESELHAPPLKIIGFQTDRLINLYCAVLRVNIEVLHVNLDSNDLNVFTIIIALFY